MAGALRLLALTFSLAASAAIAAPSLVNADLSNQRLKLADFRFAVATGVNLRNAEIEKADFRYARLDRADLRGAGAAYSRWDGASLAGADLRGIDLLRG